MSILTQDLCGNLTRIAYREDKAKQSQIVSGKDDPPCSITCGMKVLRTEKGKPEAGRNDDSWIALLIGVGTQHSIGGIDRIQARRK